MDSGRNKPSGRYRDRSYDDGYEREYERRPRQYRRRPHPEPEPEPRRRPRRKRRVWPVLLAGCGLGVLFTVIAAAVVVLLAIRSSQGGGIGGLAGLGTPQTFTHEDTQQVPLTSISQIQVCDKIGNVSIAVDPKASSATVTTKKIVHVNSQNDANQEFKRVVVEVQPPGTITNTLTCASLKATPTASGTPSSSTQGNPDSTLIVNTTIPNSEGLLHASSDAVDIAITLPPTVLPTTGPSMLVNIEAPVGNVNVDGLSGVLNIKGSTGDVTVTHAILVDGSRISTDQGNVTFNGLLVVPPSAQTARYMILSEQGNINVTLPDNTNVTLDANTNVGSINSDFNIPVQNGNGSAPSSYHGPLIPNTQPASVLVLDVSTGSINIHKAAS